MPDLDFGIDIGSMLDKVMIGGKYVLYAILFGVSAFVIFFLTSFKTKIILLHPRVEIIRAKIIRKKDGTKYLQLLPDAIKFNGITYPKPEDKISIYSKRGSQIYCGYKAEDGQIHWLNPHEYVGTDGIKVVPVDYYNWFFIRGKERVDRYKKKQSIQGILLGVGIIVFIVMVAVTFMYLFKNAPKSIAVNIAQTAANMIPAS